MNKINYEKIKEFGLLTLAVAVMAVGIYFFKFANNFSFGGVSGLSIVLAAVMPYSPGTITLVINVVLLILGFIFLGRSFGIKTVYTSLLLSILLKVLEWWYPMERPLTDQPVLELIFAVALPAISSAILFNIGASGGGTDIVAMILKKYTKLDNIGTPLFLTDLAIVILSCLVFDVQTGLFSMLGLLAKSLMIDGVIENINLCKYFTIICDDPQPICAFIHERLNRSATVFEGEGTFQHQKKYVILTVMKRSQAVELRSYIKANQPGAFLMITNSSEIIGKGFRGLN